MQKFKNWLNRIEIQIVSDLEDGYPVSTTMKHRFKKNGRWIYDFDLDSGEQGAVKDIPNRVRELLFKRN